MCAYEEDKNVKWYDNIVEYIDGKFFYAKEMMKFDDCV